MWRIVRPQCRPVSQFCLRSRLTVGDGVEQHVLQRLSAANIASSEEDSNGNASREGLGASQMLLKSVQQCRTRKSIHLLVNTCQDKCLTISGRLYIFEQSTPVREPRLGIVVAFDKCR